MTARRGNRTSCVPLIAAALSWAAAVLPAAALAQEADVDPPVVRHTPCAKYKDGAALELRTQIIDASALFDPRVVLRERVAEHLVRLDEERLGFGLSTQPIQRTRQFQPRRRDMPVPFGESALPGLIPFPEHNLRLGKLALVKVEPPQ